MGFETGILDRGNNSLSFGVAIANFGLMQWKVFINARIG
jgi:hypothetical protein